MPDVQDWYLGQIVNEGEMDTIYTDLAAAERNLARESHLGQGPAISAHRQGGILSGLLVTYDSPTSVLVSEGAARDGNGKRIALDDTTGGTGASVSLTNLGDTPEGQAVGATGDGSLTASSITAGEAWLSLFLAYDTNLADTRIDALNNTINFRQTESFHFELMIGTDSAAPATSRANLADTRVLLADILLDNSGEIREISGYKAIISSTRDLNRIGYGPEDTAALFGRRGDWVAIDPDGTLFTLLQTAYDTSEPHNHAYHNIRAGSPREAMEQLIELYATPGTATKAGGSEVIGGRPVTGKVLSSPPGGAVALQMPAGSIHDQLEALYDKVNTLLSRGNDTLTGNLVITGTLNVTGKITAATDLDVTNTLHVLASGDLDCDGPADFAEDVYMAKALDVDGTVTLNGSPTSLAVGYLGQFNGELDHNGNTTSKFARMSGLECTIPESGVSRAALSISTARCRVGYDDVLYGRWARRSPDPSGSTDQFLQEVIDQWGMHAKASGYHHRHWIPAAPAGESHDYTLDEFNLAFHPWNVPLSAGYLRIAGGSWGRSGLLVQDYDGAHVTAIRYGNSGTSATCVFRVDDWPMFYCSFYVPTTGDRTKDRIEFGFSFDGATGRSLYVRFDGGSVSDSITLVYFDGTDFYGDTIRASGHAKGWEYTVRIGIVDFVPEMRTYHEVFEGGTRLARGFRDWNDAGPPAIPGGGEPISPYIFTSAPGGAGGTGFVIQETCTAGANTAMYMRPFPTTPAKT